jgi:hypothetical protein
MPEQFVRLNCQSCGGKLEVYRDMEQFACGYCGTEMIVQRRGGTVALKAVTEAIKQVQIGTDKTAAELALARLESEMKDLKITEAALREQSGGTLWMIFGAIFASLGIAAAFEIVVLGVILILLGCVLGFAGWGLMTSKEAKLPKLERRIAALSEKIDEKKQIVDA